jgi:hypothetical protein
MLGFSWVAALILLCLLAAAGWLIRRGLRRALAPWRRRPTRELDGMQSTATGSRDWATQVLDEGRTARRHDRGSGTT